MLSLRALVIKLISEEVPEKGVVEHIAKGIILHCDCRCRRDVHNGSSGGFRELGKGIAEIPEKLRGVLRNDSISCNRDIGG